MQRNVFILVCTLAAGSLGCGGEPRHTEAPNRPPSSSREDEQRREALLTEPGGPRTAQEQGNSEEDLSITRQIRQAVVADSRLSLRAKNIVIITRDGIVTLEGGLNNADEREVISSLVRLVSGVRRVDDRLHVGDE
jgi:osmotically-inducible protein OsmY